jgi:hypothetical protein
MYGECRCMRSRAHQHEDGADSCTVERTYTEVADACAFRRPSTETVLRYASQGASARTQCRRTRFRTCSAHLQRPSAAPICSTNRQRRHAALTCSAHLQLPSAAPTRCATDGGHKQRRLIIILKPAATTTISSFLGKQKYHLKGGGLRTLLRFAIV